MRFQRGYAVKFDLAQAYPLAEQLPYLVYFRFLWDNTSSCLV
jgi:hypothetical protein